MAAAALGAKRPAAEEDVATSKKPRLDRAVDFAALTNAHEAQDATTPSSPRSTNFTEQISIADTSLTSRSSKRPKKYVCEYEGCTKAFDRPVRLEAHVRTHTDERPFACEEEGCDKAYYKVEHLKAHVANKHSQGAEHVCDYVITTTGDGDVKCGKSYATATRLRRHLAVHEQKEETKCKVPGCGQVFRKMETLQRHVKADHLGENAFRCTQVVYDAIDIEAMGEECGQEFPTIGQLKAHVNRDHTGNKHFCEICSPPPAITGDEAFDDIEAASYELSRVGFITYNDLQRHLKTVHPPTCTECNKPFPSERALKAHNEIEHSDLSSRQTHSCPYPDCDRGFTRAGNLKVHIQTVHVKAKKFICGEFDLSASDKLPGWDGHGCGMAVGTKASLENHVRTQHLGLSDLQKRGRKTSGIKAEQVDHHTTTSTNAPDALSLLTGSGYADNRPLACWEEPYGCVYRFIREHDLAQHMELTHGWNIDDISDRMAEKDALENEQFWVGGGDELVGGGDEDEQDAELRRSLNGALNLQTTTLEDSGEMFDSLMQGQDQDGDAFMALDPALTGAS